MSFKESVPVMNGRKRGGERDSYNRGERERESLFNSCVHRFLILLFVFFFFFLFHATND